MVVYSPVLLLLISGWYLNMKPVMGEHLHLPWREERKSCAVALGSDWPLTGNLS